MGQLPALDIALALVIPSHALICILGSVRHGVQAVPGSKVWRDVGKINLVDVDPDRVRSIDATLGVAESHPGDIVALLESRRCGWRWTSKSSSDH